MTPSAYRKLLPRLVLIHKEMFDMMGRLYEVSDPRVGLALRLADIMTPLRNFVPREETPPAEEAD